MWLFISKVAAIGLYACQAWNFRTKHVRQMESTYFQLLKRLLRVPETEWVEVSYEKLIEFGEKLHCKILPFEVLLYRHQLAYLGHLARREDDQLQKLILRSRLAAGVPIPSTSARHCQLSTSLKKHGKKTLKTGMGGEIKCGMMRRIIL